MKICRVGFIGAGKVGSSLGRYLKENGINITGYFSKTAESAKLVAEFTTSRVYTDIQQLLKDSDTLFLTVPDGKIGEVWDYMKKFDVKNKNICHCSGSISSTAFFDAEKLGAYSYSIHPLLAISDKFTSWRSLKEAFFCIEGSMGHLAEIKDLFGSMGNHVVAIDTEKKPLYHAAAVIASNLSTALFQIGADMLKQCGFNAQESQEALWPLFLGNAANIAHSGTIKALTGPIERGDVCTIQKHLEAFANFDVNSSEKILYLLLSQRLLKLAESRQDGKDYDEVAKLLAKELKFINKRLEF